MLEVYPEKHAATIKTRARKGIPDAMRGYAWQVMGTAKQDGTEQDFNLIIQN